MSFNNIKLVSLNVNGLNNPVKRSKVVAKLKKEKAQVIFLQETHLPSQEHEKLKRLGYKNTYYNSYRQSRKRGVATLIANSVRFECYREVSDKEGRYFLIKGKLENKLVTLVNIHAPPGSKKSDFKDLFNLVTQESEGLVVCAGAYNVVLNRNIDITSVATCKHRLTNFMNTILQEVGLIDVWRTLNPQTRDYTHYSVTPVTYSRIDYFLINIEEIHNVTECKIGVADVSDHSLI